MTAQLIQGSALRHVPMTCTAFYFSLISSNCLQEMGIGCIGCGCMVCAKKKKQSTYNNKKLKHTLRAMKPYAPKAYVQNAFLFCPYYAHKLLITKNILSRNSGESILQTHAEECHPSLTCSLIKCPVGTTLKANKGS